MLFVFPHDNQYYYPPGTTAEQRAAIERRKHTRSVQMVLDLVLLGNTWLCFGILRWEFDALIRFYDHS